MIINGVDITKHVKNCTISLQDLDSESSVRNVRGQMMRDRIDVKRKINLEFAPLRSTEIKAILTAVSGVFFDVIFQDPLDGRIVKSMYVGDRSAALYDSNKGLWLGLKFNLIER